RKLPFNAFVVLTTALLLSASFTTPAAAFAEREKNWAQVQASGSGNMDVNKYWLAEPQLHEALEIAEHFGVKDLRLAKSLGELGRYYTIRGQFPVAEPYLEKELAVRQEVLGIQNGKTIPAM